VKATLRAKNAEQRRRRIAMALADGMSVPEICRALKLRRAIVEREREAIEADPNNLAYLSPKRAFAQRLDAYDVLEQEARTHMKAALAKGKLDVANKWFESLRRIGGERGRLLREIGVFNRAFEDVSAAAAAPDEGATVSTKAKSLLARIALAEKRGRAWDVELRVDESALEPVPDPRSSDEIPPGSTT